MKDLPKQYICIYKKKNNTDHVPGMLAVLPVGDELGDHRVVVDGDESVNSSTNNNTVEKHTRVNPLRSILRYTWRARGSPRGNGFGEHGVVVDGDE